MSQVIDIIEPYIAGPQGKSGTIESATAKGLAAGAQPTVKLGGTPESRTIEFGLPKGDKGDKGDKGAKGDPGAGSVNSVNGDLGPNIVLNAASVGALPAETTAGDIGGVPVTRVSTEGVAGITKLASATDVERGVGLAAVTPSSLDAATVSARSRSGFVAHDESPSQHFDKLIAGMRNATQDTRVVALGSSTMNGGNAPEVQKLSLLHRLAYQSGATELQRLDSLAAAPSGPGMKWWRGAQGGTTSANYADATRRGKAILAKPDYVLHMVGSNDWAGSVPIATYKANVKAVIAAIESGAPGSITVLIQQQARHDTSGSIAWSQYGNALKELAAELPARRVFIDLDSAFDRYGLGLASNPWGLITADKIHMGTTGHRIAAEVIGSKMGIPSPSELGAEMVGPLTLATSKDYTINGVFGVHNILPAAYPRKITVAGLLYLQNKGGTGSSDIYVNLGDRSDTYRVMAQAVGPYSQAVNSDFILPARTVGVVNLGVSFGGHTVYVSGTAGYHNINITETPY